MKIKITFFHTHYWSHSTGKKNVLSSLKMFFAPFKSPVNPFSWFKSNPPLIFLSLNLTFHLEMSDYGSKISYWIQMTCFFNNTWTWSTPDISHLIMCLCAPYKGLGYTCLASNTRNQYECHQKCMRTLFSVYGFIYLFILILTISISISYSLTLSHLRGL